MISLGHGILTWPKSERVSDRYGVVFLMTDGDTSLTAMTTPKLDEKVCREMVGAHGRLVAIVEGVRTSTHIGDFFHGVFPTKPEMGEKIELGSGEFFTEQDPVVGFTVGLLPDNCREDIWLDIHKLYRAHEQLVNLVFLPD